MGEAPAPSARAGGRWVLLGARVGLGVGLLALVVWLAPWADGPEGPERAPGLLTCLRRAGWGSFAGAAAVYGAVIVCGVVRYRVLLVAGGAAIGLRATARLVLAGVFANLVLPGQHGGDVLRAAMAARHTDGLARAVAATAMDRLVGLACVAGLAVGPAVAAFGDPRYRTAGLVCGVLLAGGAAGLGLYLWPPVRRRLGAAAGSGSRVVRALAALDAAVVAYRHAPRALAIAVCASLAGQLLGIALLALLAHALGLPPVQWLLAAPALFLLAAVPLTPGGLGVGEAAYAWLLPTLGIPAGGAVALALCYRATTLAWGAVGGLVLALGRRAPGPTPTAP